MCCVCVAAVGASALHNADAVRFARRVHRVVFEGHRKSRRETVGSR